MASSSRCNAQQNFHRFTLTDENCYQSTNNNFCRSCPRSGRVGRMTFFKRCCLIIFFLQIGCLALDHSISELEYEEDDLRLIVGNSFPPESLNNDESMGDDENGDNGLISFDPKSYDFKESPIGIPRLGKVRVDNRLKEENLKLISISGNTVNFHSSFFADKVIGPGNGTTFEVVFVSRQEGLFESVLNIHTSKGLFNYHVRGVGLPNPYRLRPLVGAVIPVNATYEPIIMIHNPHDTRILIVEMLSSGSDFSLRLPDDVDEHDAWSIEPFQTKPVMQGSFHGKIEGNHSGFIRIKVNHTAISGEYLMVPVEVQVSSCGGSHSSDQLCGIYSLQESLDFGTLVRSDKPKTLSLSIINAQTYPVNVQSVAVKGDPNSAIRIEFRPVVIEPGVSASTVVALITLDPSQISSVQQSSGYIEVRSECGKSLTIPFQAQFYEGELEYNSSSLGFFVKADSIPHRNFSVRNNFSSAVAIYHVSVNHPDVVHVDNLNQTHILIPGEQKTIFTLKVQKKADLCDGKSDVKLTLKSNITNLSLPISCYDGKLQLHTAENGQLDFGRVDLYTTSTEYFSVENINPIEIRLKSWGSNSSWSQVELVGMQKGTKYDISKIRDFDSLKKSLFLQPGYMAVFSIDIRRPTVEGIFYGESYLTTDHNQTLRVPFRFIVSRGSIHSDTILFDKVFPGKISFEKLYLSSTFNNTLNLLRVRSFPSSAVWFSSSTLQDFPEILPHRKSFVGKVHFDPRSFCNQDCYAGFSLDSELGNEWIKGAHLNWETGVIDSRIWKILQYRFTNVKETIVSNISLWVDSSGPGGFKMKAQVKYVWPRLAALKVTVFPLTALGNESVMEVVLYNPSNSPVIVQAAMAEKYGPLWKNFVVGNYVGGNTTEGSQVFSVNNISSSSHANGSGASDVEVESTGVVEDSLGLQSFPGVKFIIQPGTKSFISLKFKPVSKDMTSTVLLLRNNLTGIETVWLKGRAGTGQLTVGNGTPGSSLLFQLTEKLLQGCEDEPANKYVPPQLTVRRSFVARNVGEIPLEIMSLEIYPPQGSLWSLAVGSANSQQDACEGYGFRILNCHPFILQPNQTHSVDIAFTPDFTLSKVVRSLRLTDSTGGHFNYSLVALIPSGMLTICASIIARPAWEPYFKYFVAVGAIILLLVGAVISYFEATTVVSSTVLATVRVVPKESSPDGSREEKTQKLDLKAVYDKVENRFRRNQENQQKSQQQAASTVASTCLPVVSGKTQRSMTSTTATTVAATDNGLTCNGNLRNRKNNKKPPNDTNPSPTNITKFPEKISHNSLSRSNSSINEDSGLLSNFINSNLVTGKKEKENIGTNKKKKNNNQQNVISNSQPSSNNKVKKLQNKIDNFGTPTLPDKNKQRAEEETSSTTTESSNPDDFILPPYLEKDSKKHSNHGGMDKNKKKDKRDKRNEFTGSTENLSTASELAGGKMMSEADCRKKLLSSTKKRGDSSECSSQSGTKGSGNVSPRQELNLWDTPRPGSGSGLSEMSALTEQFVMQRPVKRNNSGGDPSSSNAIGSRASISPGPGILNALHMNHSFNNQHQQPNRPKKPGVIGQPRLAQTIPNHMSMQSMGNPMQSMSPTLPMSGYPPYMHAVNSMNATTNRQMSPTERTLLNNGSVWGSDILPDNGCDIWGRRSLDSTTTPSSTANYLQMSRPDHNPHTFNNHGHNNYRSSQSFGVPTSIGGGLLGSDYPVGLPSSSANNISQPVSHVMNNGGSVRDQNVPRDSSNLHGTGSDFLFSGGISEELANNIWPMNNGYTDSYRSSQGNYPNGSQPSSAQQQQSGFGLNQPTAMATHNYLQRMRSDPTGRTQQRTSGKPWAESNFSADTGIHGTRGQIQRSAEPSVPAFQKHWMPPPRSPTKAEMESVEASYADWRAVGQARLSDPDSHIWDTTGMSGNNTASKWPTSYECNQVQPNYSSDSPMAVGSGPRSAVGNTSRHEESVGSGSSSSAAQPLTELGLRNRTSDMSQNLREVEAGLGFNPFKSDIWNQAAEGQSWGGSGYRYSPNE